MISAQTASPILTTCQSEMINSFLAVLMQKYYKKSFDKYFIKRFANIYEFYNGDINKFILLLRKGIYP